MIGIVSASRFGEADSLSIEHAAEPRRADTEWVGDVRRCVVLIDLLCSSVAREPRSTPSRPRAMEPISISPVATSTSRPQASSSRRMTGHLAMVGALLAPASCGGEDNAKRRCPYLRLQSRRMKALRRTSSMFSSEGVAGAGDDVLGVDRRDRFQRSTLDEDDLVVLLRHVDGPSCSAQSGS